MPKERAENAIKIRKDIGVGVCGGRVSVKREAKECAKCDGKLSESLSRSNNLHHPVVKGEGKRQRRKQSKDTQVSSERV